MNNREYILIETEEDLEENLNNKCTEELGDLLQFMYGILNLGNETKEELISEVYIHADEDWEDGEIGFLIQMVNDFNR